MTISGSSPKLTCVHCAFSIFHYRCFLLPSAGSDHEPDSQQMVLHSRCTIHHSRWYLQGNHKINHLVLHPLPLIVISTSGLVHLNVHELLLFDPLIQSKAIMVQKVDMRS